MNNKNSKGWEVTQNGTPVPFTVIETHDEGAVTSVTFNFSSAPIGPLTIGRCPPDPKLIDDQAMEFDKAE